MSIDKDYKSSIKVLYLTSLGFNSLFTHEKMELVRRGLAKRPFFDWAMSSMKKYSIKVDYMTFRSRKYLNRIAQTFKTLILLDNYDIILTDKGTGLILSLMRFLHPWKRPRARLLIIMWQVEIKSMLDSHIKRIIGMNIDNIICVSSVQKRTFATLLNISRWRIKYVPLGIDTTFFKPEPNAAEDFILCVGDADRDDETLMKAVMDLPVKLVRVSDEQKNIEVLRKQLIGSKPFYFKEKLTLLHKVSDIELEKLYAKSKVVVIPIRCHSNQPAGLTTLLEAMAMGKPVIVTKGLITEGYVINGKTGIVIQPGDVAQLKNAIMQLLDNDSKRRKIGNNARKRAEENFTLKRSTERLASLLQNIKNES